MQLWTLSEKDTCVHMCNSISGDMYSLSATVVIQLCRPQGAGRAGSLVLSPNLECLLVFIPKVQILCLWNKNRTCFSDKGRMRIAQTVAISPQLAKGRIKGSTKVARTQLRDKSPPFTPRNPAQRYESDRTAFTEAVPCGCQNSQLTDM